MRNSFDIVLSNGGIFMNVIRKICFMIAITTNLLLVSCVSNNENLDLVIPEKDRTADNFNPTTSRSAIKDGLVVPYFDT